MGKNHRYYLSLGSNISPESNLAEAIRRLQDHGRIGKISGVWESHAIGSTGPNFLNICVEFTTPLSNDALKSDVANRIESQMGRVRSADVSAPRPIDIDILMVDEQALNVDRWSYPFVLLPLAELLPDYAHPTDDIPLSTAAEKAAGHTWIIRRATRIPEQVPRRGA
jgi:2-amino-4-hydroxy-6-hydroxymethyldihydropteridine diphosphokinase